MEVMDAARIESVVEPDAVGAVEMPGRQLVEADRSSVAVIRLALAL